jgi:hypothetical protein
LNIFKRVKSSWKKLRRIPSAERFALAPVGVQLVAIFITSAAIIFLLSPILGDLATSYRIFADPANYANVQGPVQVVVGLIQVLLGLVLFSFIISVLSAALVKYIESIKSGSLAFKGKGHIIIVNYNVKLPLILDQLDIRARDKGVIEDVVLLFSDTGTVEKFYQLKDIERWKHLEVFIRQGDLMSFQTFARLSIFDALSLVILLPDSFEDHFLTDNFNLKILTALMNEVPFKSHLISKETSRKPIKCTIELSSNTDCQRIAHQLSKKLFTVVTPGDVIASMLARAKVDLVYYKIFFEVMAFDGATIHFVDPKHFKIPLEGKSFETLYFGFKGGILLGYSRVDAFGKYQMDLCPFGAILSSNDWLLFLTSNVNRIHFKKDTFSLPVEVKGIIPSNEIVNKQICIIGDKYPLGNIDDFIDVQSMKALNEAHFVFANEEDYFKDEFILSLKHKEFQNIIINMEDELGFRLTTLLVSRNEKEDHFLKKLVTILGDPTIEKLLSHHTLGFQTMLSHKLSARYIAQITFQKNLDILFEELAFAEGAEFNLLEIGKNIPREILTNAEELKKALAAYQMIYIGIADNDNNVFFEANEFSKAKQILVLSHGEVSSKSIPLS